MNPQDFINKYNNKITGTNAVNRGQCTGLFEQFLQDSGWGSEAGNAKDLFANADPNHFQKIANNPNDPNQIPVEGDWFVFGPEPWNGGLGHTGMIISASPRSFIGFEQNNPVGSLSHGVSHSTGNPWAGMLGWLRPNVAHPAPTPSSNVAGKWAVTNRSVNERTAPHVVPNNITYVLGAGTRFQVVEMVTGDSVGGNNLWAKTPHGFYIWSGNLTISA